MSKKITGKLCGVCKKDHYVVFNSKYGGYLCSKHQHHIRRHGKILKRTVYDKNEIKIIDDIALLITYNKNGKKNAKFLIDKKMVEKVEQYKWFKTVQGYAGTDIERKRVFLHNFLLETKKGLWGDHINGDKFDNRLSNLRQVTPYQNNLNRPSLGIYQFKKGCKSGMDLKWQAYITINGKRKHLGYFDRKEEALRVRNEAQKKYFGNFARMSE